MIELDDSDEEREGAKKPNNRRSELSDDEEDETASCKTDEDNNNKNHESTKQQKVAKSEGHELVCAGLNLKKKDLDTIDYGQLGKTQLSDPFLLAGSFFQMSGFRSTEKVEISLSLSGEFSFKVKGKALNKLIIFFMSSF